MRRSTSARVSEPTSERPLTTLETVATETPAISASCERVRASEDAGPAWGASSVEVIDGILGVFSDVTRRRLRCWCSPYPSRRDTAAESFRNLPETFWRPARTVSDTRLNHRGNLRLPTGNFYEIFTCTDRKVRPPSGR